MTRKDFLKICALLGIGVPAQILPAACNNEEDGNSNFEGKVLIIGAGSAGLTAGYLLNQRGIEFEILEASSTHGGRMKSNYDFADFPIPLGAEWLHVNPSVFDQIVNDSSTAVNVETVGYQDDDSYAIWDDGMLTPMQVDGGIDRKFVNSTWLGFFDEYIVPSVSNNITFNAIVESVDYSGDQVLVRTATNEYSATRVIVTVPLKVLQEGSVTFSPDLPTDKVSAIRDARVWDGAKAFIEFSSRFYPTFTDFAITPETAGQKLYYDASYGQQTSRHILGLFSVGSAAQPYISRSGEELKNYILQELDEIFENQASPAYVNHIFQNWNEEPFARAAYLNDNEDWRRVRTLGESVNDKIFFAGEAYTSGEDWGSVHAAALSAKEVVSRI